MRKPDEKAVIFVTGGAVRVATYEWGNALFDDGTDDMLLSAAGTVRSGANTYQVTFDIDGNTCTCHYGTHRTLLEPDSHSHDTALRIAATRLHKEKQDG